MQNPEEELRQYRQQIYKDVVFLMNTRLKLLKEFTDANNRLVWKSPLGGLSSVLYDSLFDNLIVTLSWLYSPANRDKRSLVWYLNQVKANTDKFSSDEIDDQLKKIESVADIIDRVKTVRDKWVGHRDPIAFNNPKDFMDMNNIQIADFESLIRLAEEIINEHFGRFEDAHLIFDLPINGIDLLVKGENSRVDIIRFAEKIVLSRRKPNFEEQKNSAVEELLEKHNLFY